MSPEVHRPPGGVRGRAVTALPRTARAFALDPRRRATVGLGIGAAALLLAFLLGGWRNGMISYLPAWLCLLALPAGALPVVIMVERADAWRPQPETALLETLRWLLTLMPVAALLGLPILFALPVLYPWAAGAPQSSPLAAIWFTTPFVLARVALAFTVWIALAIVFARRGGEPWGKAGRIDDGRAVLGLGLHILFGSLMAGDLVMAVSGRFQSSLSGLLLMAGWSSLALSAAILVAPPDVGPSRRRLDRLTPLAILLAIWAAMHLVQAFILRPTALTEAAAWYGARGNAQGRALALVAGAVVLLAAANTLKPGEYRARLVAALALVVQMLALAWFVTPSLRGTFALTLVDALAFVGVAGLAIGLQPLARRFFPGLLIGEAPSGPAPPPS
ncbi:hypothetical protein [Methylobacterium haplocladii]|uniref:Uncharacterized protein n=1 Tax=Methylobacterium haplocladii TaxID=1176176 RepID=A0A512ILC8_9HYPH|nr:hypothetical protein [Methylobacterium haplocladii]GEO98485.1 hypothetical protein MHA02_08730 [Methylobacterium haplocladii]GJD82791.1 hypothetical protein HPGCJGGD_0651 [Methylobacterium haplocladii]GLS61121.1 hypothetical protein GCM10007887_38160 [Methylobacterium haplocladii]